MSRPEQPTPSGAWQRSRDSWRTKEGWEGGHGGGREVGRKGGKEGGREEEGSASGRGYLGGG